MNQQPGKRTATGDNSNSGETLGTEAISRREFFSFARSGIGAAAMASLMLKDGTLQANDGETTGEKSSPAVKAKYVIHVVACGGVSQIDTFDYKPELEKFHGKPLGGEERPDVFFGQVGLLRKSDWKFKQRGKSGLWISDMLPQLSTVADQLTVIRSMYAETSNHTPATFQENTGFRLNGFPVLGSWLSYGLGSESEDLPAYVVIPDSRGLPAGGSINWTNGFLPARFQGTTMRSRGEAIDDLFPAREIPALREQASRDLLVRLNQRHLRERGQSDPLSARMRSYELAARMQLAVPEVVDLDRESKQTHAAYGLGRKETNDFGRSCLLARRLLEKGVRFVQLFSGGAFGSPRINWDGHENMIQNHGREAGRIDQPLAALINDLQQRGMLDETLILFTSEFGRTPFTQSADGVLGIGRDHNQYGFSVWMAGAGLKKGIAYGGTDEIGMKAVENRVHWNDFHATVLHLLGIDHQRLTYYHNGLGRRLTNVGGRVIKELLS